MRPNPKAHSGCKNRLSQESCHRLSPLKRTIPYQRFSECARVKQVQREMSGREVACECRFYGEYCVLLPSRNESVPTLANIAQIRNGSPFKAIRNTVCKKKPDRFPGSHFATCKPRISACNKSNQCGPTIQRPSPPIGSNTIAQVEGTILRNPKRSPSFSA